MATQDKDSERSDADGKIDLAPEQIAKEINEEMGNGGGCTEAWEAAQRIRDSNLVANNSRRHFLGAIISSVVLGGAANTAAADDRDINKTQIEEEVGELETNTTRLDANDTAELANEILENKDVKDLRKYLKRNEGSKGKMDVSDSSAYRVNYRDQNWEFIHVPFRAQSNNDADINRSKAGIIWSSREGRDPYGYHVLLSQSNESVSKTESNGFIENTQLDHDDITTYKEIVTTIQVNDGKTTTTEVSNTTPLVDNKEKLEDELRGGASIENSYSTENILECACFISLPPQGTCPPCSSYDWGCVYQIAENFSAEIAICGTCAATKNTTPCAACMGYAVEYILSGGYNDLCCPCSL